MLLGMWYSFDMKTAIILHGKPSKKGYYDPNREAQSNSHWLSWIQHELLLNDILAQAIELPEPYTPNYDDWKKIFELLPVNKDTILIGHSRGAGFLIRWLSENDVETDKVALVAPSLMDNKEVEHGFSNFEIDKDFPSKTKRTTVFYSKDDVGSVKYTVNLLKEKVDNIEYQEFEDKGHFTMGDMNTKEFPELKQVLLGD